LHDEFFEHDEGPPYVDPDSINPNALPHALRNLELFGSDAYLSMQATNLAVVDTFAMKLESQLLSSYVTKGGSVIAEATFLLAQSQMWIFAAYEALRTWRQRAKQVLRLADNGGFALKIADLRKDVGFQHHGRLMLADQYERISQEPSLLDKVRDDLRRVHIPFARMEMVRVSLAKHEVSGKPNALAYAPGYGRINRWCGALDFELSNGPCIFGTVSRRDVADEIRAIPHGEVPSEQDLASFDEAMKGPPPTFEQQ